MEDNKIDFQKYKLLVDSVLKRGSLVFGEEWLDSEWGMNFQSLQTEMDHHIMDNFFSYHDKNLSLALLKQIAWDEIEDVDKIFLDISNYFTRIVSLEERVIEENEVVDLLIPFNFDGETTKKFLAKLRKTKAEDWLGFFGNLKLLSVKFTFFGSDLELILAALCYYQPKKSILSFGEFQKIAENQINNNNNIEDDWSEIFRYLGQAFIQRDVDVMFWAVDFLIDFTPDKNVYDFKIDEIFFTLLLHNAFWDFENDPDEIQEKLLMKYSFACLYFDVDIKKNLERYLFQQPLLNYFVVRSHSLSESISKSSENIFSEQEQSITVGNFIKRFLAFAGGKQLEGFNQLQYINEIMSEYKFNRSIRDILYKILNLYIHLRECDMVDYRGFLSDEGAKEGVNWKEIFENNLSDKELSNLKEELELLQRPFRNKLEIFFILSKINWKEEPYFSRVLAINNMFEEIYPQYSPLVFFDEQDGDWKIDRSIPKVFDISQLSNFYPNKEDNNYGE